MAEKTLTGEQRVLLSVSKNRPYNPKAAADILSAYFYLDGKLQKKVMKLTVRSRSERPICAMRLSAFYLDRDGHVIGDARKPHVLVFRNIACAPGKTALLGKLVVLPYQDIAGIEAYITDVAYETEEETESFYRGDYILTPAQKTLESCVGAEEYAVICRRLGAMDVFVPQMGAGAHWYCSCGAAAEGERCAVCRLSRRRALDLCSPKRIAGWLGRQKTRRVLGRVLPITAAAALLVGGGILFAKYAARYAEEHLPERRLAVTRRFIEENRYREALGYSAAKNEYQLYTEILDAAVEYYCSIHEYDMAAEFERCRETPGYDRIYESAARAYAQRTTDAGLSYALSVTDDALYNDVLRRLSEDALSAGDRKKACSYALSMRGEAGAAYADALLSDTAAMLLKDSLYSEAVHYIGLMRDQSGISALCSGIEQELLSRGEYDAAFTVAGITGDDSVFALAYHSVNSGTIRRYYDKFAPLMTPLDRREFLACAIDAGGSLVYITSDGKAVDSDAGELCEKALSVAAGESHVLVLQKDGTVRAFGNNSLGQCGCDGLKNAVAVAAGKNHSLILLADGTVRAFGDNSQGQCEVGGWTSVIAIAAGQNHSAALTSAGMAMACGSNASGQCGISTYKNVVSLAAGDYSTVLIFRDGSIAVNGNIALETFDSREWEDVVRVAAGSSHLVALTSGGRILYAGNPGYTGTDEAQDWSRLRAITCTSQAVYAMDVNGKILFCGSELLPLSGSGEENMTE